MECVGLDVRSFREVTSAGKVTRKPVGERMHRLDATTWRAVHPLIPAERASYGSEFLPAFAAGELAGMPDEARAAAAELAGAFAEGPSRRRSLDLEHFRKVAELYAQAVAAGRPDPSRAVQSAYPWASRGAVRKWVARCRELKLLPPTGERRASRAQDLESRQQSRKGRGKQ